MTETQPQTPVATKRGNPYRIAILTIAMFGLLIGAVIWISGLYADEGSLATTMMDAGANVFSIGVLFTCASLLYAALTRDRE
jgi:polyferredoxin